MFDVSLQNKADFIKSDDEKSNAWRNAQLSAATCYQPTFDDAYNKSENIDVHGTLFKAIHHTTMQHQSHYATFKIDNIPISLVTFGLHMGHPFYNSSQRSGRYCKTMFESNSRFDQYVRTFVERHTSIANPDVLINWLHRGLNFFNENLDDAAQVALNALQRERPFYKQNAEVQALRIAQDQLRCVLSTIAPTGLIHTVNITSLFALYLSAWNTPMKSLLQQMLDEFSESDFGEFVKDIPDQEIEYTPTFNCMEERTQLVYDPSVRVLNSMEECRNIRSIIEKLYNDKQNKLPIDTLLFNPKFNPISELSNRNLRVLTTVPVVTFGQDQRHRTIKRSNPTVTGEFYVPPIVAGLPKAQAFCQQHMDEYFEMVKLFSPKDMIHFIPYGAMVRYVKEADPRAYLHSINKRLCWNAESCIAKMEQQTLNQLYFDSKSPLGPGCFTQSCHEGQRWCGRDINVKMERNLL